MCRQNTLVILIVIVCIVALVKTGESVDVESSILPDLNDDTITADTYPNTEDRAFKIQNFPVKLKTLFRKNPKLEATVRSNPEIAKAFQDPAVRKSFGELQKRPSLIQHFGENPSVNKFARQMQGKPLTKEKVERIGQVVIKSSNPSMTRVLVEAALIFGASLIFTLGLAVLLGLYS
ncbi:Avirulence (Avh) protein [Phytophthora megakarya]|uniref:Avirulence (Avh) protein n=1 Tax=Phytophthora megakarya TaxID=4795 RepID=A0A225X1T0_9STRA|nr:Avirulence (Avh) protein [Phytophthora megakarya]